MKIEKNKVISVTYDLYSSNVDSEQRAHVESTGNNQPLIFLFGSGNLIPEFEDNLLGLAGYDLHFTGRVVEVREATDDEITHGHAHIGKGGH